MWTYLLGKNLLAILKLINYCLYLIIGCIFKEGPHWQNIATRFSHVLNQDEIILNNDQQQTTGKESSKNILNNSSK